MSQPTGKQLMRPINGLVAMVTGGASNLGKTTVEHLHRNGAKVVLLDHPLSDGASVAEGLGNGALFTPAEVTNEEHVRAAMVSVKEKFRRLDALLNCTDVIYGHRIYDTSKREMDAMASIKHTLNVNLLGTLNVSRHAIHLMLDNHKDGDGQRGVIINTASIAAYDGQVGQVAYSASKGAIVAATLPMARDLAQTGIRVVTIAPGLFNTNLLQVFDRKVRSFLRRQFPNHPTTGLGHPSELAALCQHAIENRYLNGEVIRIDGGLRLPP